MTLNNNIIYFNHTSQYNQAQFQLQSETIVQWNINSYFKKLPDIHRLIADFQPSAICLQETNLKNKNNPTLKNYKGYFKNRSNYGRASGGVCIFASVSSEHENIPLNTTLEAIAIKITSNNSKKICICNLYAPDSTDLTLTDLENLIQQLPRPFILLGDFNSRNTLWGSVYTDRRGRTIEKLLENDSIILLNDGNYTRHNASHNNFSAIDLSIASASLGGSIDWSVQTSYSSNDHWPITLKLLNSQPIEKSTPKWLLRNPNWSAFSNTVDNLLSSKEFETLLQPNHSTDIDNIIETFSSIITEAAETTIGKSQPSFQKKKVPWWNENCESSIKNYKKALNRYRKTKLQSDHIELKKCRAISRQIINISKTTSWKNFTSSINHKTTSSLMWSKINSIKGNNRIQTKTINSNDKTITDKKEIADAFGYFFQSNNSNENYSKDFVTLKTTIEANSPIKFEADNPDDPINSPISIIELNTSLKNKRSKSTGPDGIPFSFLQNLSLSSLNILLKIFNIIWINNIFPKQWRTSHIIPIPKPGKCLFEINNYRPISLINTMSKTLESIINTRLSWHLEVHNLLSPHQFGFRKNRSTIDPLTKIHTDICEALEKKNHLLLVSLDIDKAYDTVWKHRVLSILQKWNVNGNILKFINNFLTNRSFKVKVRHTLSSSFETENGLPQGSSLSVTLFLIAINDINTYIKSPVKTILYADDCSIYCSGSNIKTTSSLIQTAINNVIQWSIETGFKFSPSKCQSILFNRQNKIVAPEIKMQGNTLLSTKTLRLLGLTFDHKLYWKEHITKLKAASSKKLNIIKTISHFKWGADRKTLLILHNSLIQSKLDYGSTIYSLTNHNTLKTLNTVQNAGIRMATGAFRSSPIDSLLCEAHCLPLDIRQKYLITKYAAKKMSTPQTHITETIVRPYHDHQLKPFYIKLHDILEEISFKINNIKHTETIPKIPPWNMKPIEANTELAHFNKKDTPHNLIINTFYEIINNKFKNYIHFYTDASKTTNEIGFAITHPEDSNLYKIAPFSSIYTAETFAILEAITISLSTNHEKVLILSDSLSAITSITNIHTKCNLARNIQNIILTNPKNIKFMWVPSHIGIPGNERADKLAMEAAKSPAAKLYPHVTYEDVIHALKIKFHSLWQNRWEKQTNENNKLKQIKCTTKKWQDPPIKLSRHEEIMITRVRIGHTRLTHSHLMCKEPEPRCETCQSELTVKHIFLECPTYQNARIKSNLNTSSLKEAFNYGQEKRILDFIKIAELTAHI